MLRPAEGRAHSNPASRSCGWVDSSYIMMAGRSLLPQTVRSSHIFYHLGPVFIAVNVFNALLAVAVLVPLLLSGFGDGSGESGMDDGSDSLVPTALWVCALSRGGFSLLLALSSTIAGALVSYKIRDIIIAEDVEPSLRRFGYEKSVPLQRFDPLARSRRRMRLRLLLRTSLSLATLSRAVRSTLSCSTHLHPLIPSPLWPPQ